MKNIEKKLKAAANHRRLRILKYLKKNGAQNVGAISEEIRLSFKSTSRHLSVLLYAEIVEREQKGLEMYYSLSPVQKPIIKYLLSIL